MTNERLTTLLYNALSFLKDVNGTEFEELEEELGITEAEYKQIVEDYQDTICCTFGKDELREGLFETETKLTQIVNYIVDTSCKNTPHGEWSVYSEDVCAMCNISEDEYLALMEQVVNELRERDEIIDIDYVGNGDIDLRLDTDYCKKFEGRVYEYKDGELKKKDSLAEKIEKASERVESNVKSERENSIDREER